MSPNRDTTISRRSIWTWQVFPCPVWGHNNYEVEVEETKAKRKPGRRSLPADERKSRILKFRARDDFAKRVQSAAYASGRSASEEIEYRLSHSFDEERHLVDALGLAYGARAAGLLLVLAEAMKGGAGTAGRLSIKKAGAPPSEIDDWLDDPYRFQQASLAAQRVLDAVAPEGDRTPPPFFSSLGFSEDEETRDYMANRGIYHAQGLLGDIITEHPLSTYRERRPLWKRLLGAALLERISKSVGASEESGTSIEDDCDIK